MFEEPVKLALGLVTGIGFGFLLQKGGVAKFRVIMGQFLLKDWTVVKIMLTAIAVGAVGVWVLVNAGVATLHIKSSAFAALMVGGLLFGIGMAIFGYCPGTSVAACGEGRRDAMIGVVGMLSGAAIYVAAYPALKPWGESWGNLGKVTIPQMLSVSPWVFVAALAGAALFLRFLAGRQNTHLENTANYGSNT